MWVFIFINCIFTKEFNSLTHRLSICTYIPLMIISCIKRVLRTADDINIGIGAIAETVEMT